MPLPPTEIKRRIAAARMLRGIHQADLEAQLAADGLGKRDLGRIERGAVPLTKVNRQAIARALGVPERWFTVETVDELLGNEAAWEPGEILMERLPKSELQKLSEHAEDLKAIRTRSAETGQPPSEQEQPPRPASQRPGA